MWTWVGWVLWTFRLVQGCPLRGAVARAQTRNVAFTRASMFLLLPWNKLHLAWVIPLGFLIGPLATYRVIPFLSPLLLVLSRVFVGVVLSGKQSWMTMLPNHLRPSRYGALEAVRTKYGVGHRDFYKYVAGHRLTTRNLQRANFAQLKTLRPGIPDEILMRELVKMRRLATWQGGLEFFELPPGASEASVTQREEQLAM